MKAFFKYVFTLVILGACSGLIVYACSGFQDRETIGEFKEALMDYIEGRDVHALLKYVPDDMSEFEVSMDSGRSRYNPESLEDLEILFEDIAAEFNGDSLDLLQSNEDHNDNSIVFTYTVKVVDGAMERTLPLRVVFRKNEAEETWSIVHLDLYN